MAPSSVHERCSLRQRYLDRFKGLGLRPLSADVAAGHPCIESVEHILHRRVNRLPVKPPNGQRNRTSQATDFTAHALCTLNSRTDAEYRKQRNLSPYCARRGFRDRRNAAISAATAQAVKAAETNGIARSGMQVMNTPAANDPSALPSCNDEFDKLTANAASSPALSMMNEFCAGRNPQDMPVHIHAATSAASHDPVPSPSPTSVTA